MHEYAVKSAVTFVVTRPKILLKIGCKSLFTMGGGETQNRTGDSIPYVWGCLNAFKLAILL